MGKSKNMKSNNGLLSKMRNQKLPFIIMEVVALVIIVAYAVGTIYYNDKFLPGTKVNDVSVSGLSLTQANTKLSKLVSDNKLSLEFNDGSKEAIASDQMGVSYNADNKLNELLAKQTSFAWVGGLFGSSNHQESDLILIDESKLSASLKTLQHAAADKQVAPENAKVVFANGKFNIEKEKEGSTLNQEELIKKCKETIAQGKTSMNVSAVGGYVQPAIKSDSAELKSQLDCASQNCNASISYKTKSGETVTLDGNTMATWLTKNDDGTYTYDEKSFKANLTSYITKLAKSYNTVGESRTFTGADGAAHSVSGGSYGIRVLVSKETDAVLDLVKNKKTVTERTPETTGQSSAGENGGIGNTFVEVSISRQHIWYHKNGSVVLESDMVSGLASDPDRATPKGTYYITYKQRNRVLRGTKLPNGQWPYETPVKYWMPFNNGIGLHDLSRSAYGGNIYLTKGSHGCINLPESTAASLYSQIETNCPVVVY